MKVVKTIEDIRTEVNAVKMQGRKVAFVPTMGALHDGHLSLIRIAREKADDIVVSIYVNPEQFGPNDDLDTYPSNLQQDLKFCEEEGASVVFVPDTEIMYGSARKYFKLEIEELNQHLDGGSRPGYFEGITLVVNKLFNIVNPDIAVFGQKDYQQFRILNQMVKEFNHDVEMVMAPIQRAEDGLALSSRNAYLSNEERAVAPELYKVMEEVVQEIKNGLLRPKELLAHKQELLKAKGFKNDYLSVFSMDKMAPIESLKKGNTYLLAGAVYLGKARLIDNIIFEC